MKVKVKTRRCDFKNLSELARQGKGQETREWKWKRKEVMEPKKFQGHNG